MDMITHGHLIASILTMIVKLVVSWSQESKRSKRLRSKKTPPNTRHQSSSEEPRIAGFLQIYVKESFIANLFF